MRVVFGDSKARVITLGRRSKNALWLLRSSGYDRRTRQVHDLSCGDTRIYLELKVRRVQCRSCGKVKRERLDFVADNPFYTKRFAHYGDPRCRSTTNKDLAKELTSIGTGSRRWKKQYLQLQLATAGTSELFTPDAFDFKQHLALFALGR